MSFLKIISLNARSVHINYLLTYLEQTNVQLEFVQEIWLKQATGAIITSIKVGYNKPFRENINIDILGGDIALSIA